MDESATWTTPSDRTIRHPWIFNLPVHVANVRTVRQLAELTHTDVGFLEDTIQRKLEKSNYDVVAIPKRSGGRRIIHSPVASLASIQRFINSKILQRVAPHQDSYAFHRGGRGILQCAQRHCGAKWLLKFDIQDFFHGISELKVAKLFRELNYPGLFANQLARLCTTTNLPLCPALDLAERSGHRRLGVLPQGAPTSPMLSNS